MRILAYQSLSLHPLSCQRNSSIYHAHTRIHYCAYDRLAIKVFPLRQCHAVSAYSWRTPSSSAMRLPTVTSPYPSRGCKSPLSRPLRRSTVPNVSSASAYLRPGSRPDATTLARALIRKGREGGGGGVTESVLLLALKVGRFW